MAGWFAMKLMRLAFLLVTLAFCASASDIPVTWKAVFLGPKEKCPKTFCEVLLTFQLDGDKITGMAHMGSLLSRLILARVAAPLVASGQVNSSAPKLSDQADSARHPCGKEVQGFSPLLDGDGVAATALCHA
jgi:hypothetical protein